MVARRPSALLSPPKKPPLPAVFSSWDDVGTPDGRSPWSPAVDFPLALHKDARRANGRSRRAARLSSRRGRGRQAVELRLPEPISLLGRGVSEEVASTIGEGGSCAPVSDISTSLGRGDGMLVAFAVLIWLAFPGAGRGGGTGIKKAPLYRLAANSGSSIFSASIGSPRLFYDRTLPVKSTTYKALYVTVTGTAHQTNGDILALMCTLNASPCDSYGLGKFGSGTRARTRGRATRSRRRGV